MIVHPETLADHGCWISGDRVYAFISSDARGIAEVGYHGAQPASRNARVFASGSGALRFAVATSDGLQQELVLDSFDWSPGSIAVNGSCAIGGVGLEIVANGRSIDIFASIAAGEVASFIVLFGKGSMLADVHGKRTWRTNPGRMGWLSLEMRDLILLDEWMKRGGPYGSDFLIPEPLRRRIYGRQIRSGLAGPEDLLPEYRNNSLAVYDAVVRAELGGEEYCLSETGDFFSFSAPVSKAGKSAPTFRVRFDPRESLSVAGDTGAAQPSGRRVMPQSRPTSIPTIALPGYPRIEQFFATVPGLVDSCVIQELGIPRATPGGYYWIWAWDAMVTALASLRWGATDVAGKTVAFMNANRDEGRIPMRWTHALEPLDTQDPGSLETLLTTLSYMLSRESPGNELAKEQYARIIGHLEEMSGLCDRRGLFSGIGFYPDLPVRFGRTEDSSVAMEVANFYSFCRICENCSVRMGDQQTAEAARRMMTTLERSYCEVFWDKRHRFFLDSVERKSGMRNESYPLFSLLFLHYPPAIRLIEGFVKQSADFISRHLLSTLGMRLLPRWDKNTGSETVSGSWYPHWDTYACRLLRRAGHSAGIMMWLKGAERVLEHLGYVPEYLVLDRSLMRDPAAWLRHGSASNLNCVTGWYQVLLEAVLGLEFDPGGLMVVPLSLPIEEASVRGIHHLGTRWNVTAIHAGTGLEELRVDGILQKGCLKVPKSYCDGREHTVELRYGAIIPEPRFVELTNAEVLEITAGSRGVEVAINSLGQTDVGYSAPTGWALYVDDRRVTSVSPDWDGRHNASLAIVGLHTLRIAPVR